MSSTSTSTFADARSEIPPPVSSRSVLDFGNSTKGDLTVGQSDRRGMRGASPGGESHRRWIWILMRMQPPSSGSIDREVSMNRGGGKP